MTPERQALIDYRLERARETLEEAGVLLQTGHANAGVNRLYYACFYAVSALLAQEGRSSSRHSGIRSLFNRHFVKTGQINADTARIFNDLFERRQEGDYVDFVQFEESQVRMWMPQAEVFVETIAGLLGCRGQ